MKANPIILIVDDEQDSTSSLQARLVAKAYEVCIATDKTQAQEKAWAQRPGLVLLGTIMPRGSAFELHEWLRHTPPFNDVPIVVIDAAPEEQLLKGWRREEGLQLESEDYLTKPVEPTSLVHLIGKLLDKVTRKIKVLVVDDYAIVRDGIRSLLGVQNDMQVVGEAVDGKEALEKARRLSPDVVLMDIVMPVMNGLDATKRICRECEHTKVLLLSHYDDEENALASRLAGAYGFIPKRSASTQLLAAIRSLS